MCAALADLTRTSGAGEFFQMTPQTPPPNQNDDEYASIDKIRIDREEFSLVPIRRSVHFDDNTENDTFPEKSQYHPQIFENSKEQTCSQSPTNELNDATIQLQPSSKESISSSSPPIAAPRSHNIPQLLPKAISSGSTQKLTPIPLLALVNPHGCPSMKIFFVNNPFPIHSTVYGSSPSTANVIRMENHGMVRSESPGSHRSTDPAIISTAGSESPRSLRDYHKGSGTLTGGGVQEIYVRTKPDMKKYKSKLDGRLGQCIFICFLTIAVILCIYGVIHAPVHSRLDSYINKTHQIAKELKLAMDENYPTENNTDGVDAKGRRWMTVEELEDYAELTKSTNSTIWTLFWWNTLFCVLLAPILILIHCEVVSGNVAKLVYRGILVVCLLFAIAQFLYFLHPVLWGAAQFPRMVDRLFVEASPRDEYQLQSIQDDFVCNFTPHETLVQFDLQTPCLPKIKNSLFPTYSVILLIILDLFPFAFAVFIYAWDACLKNHKVFKTARTRIELNNSRRVPFPKTNTYVPPSDRNVTAITPDQLPGKFV